MSALASYITGSLEELRHVQWPTPAAGNPSYCYRYCIYCREFGYFRSGRLWYLQVPKRHNL